MNARILLTSLLATVLSAFPAKAEDTDIYFAKGGSAGGAPLVLFTLDWRPNLGATVCKGSECDALRTTGYLPSSGSVTFFELLRASLRRVMDDLAPELADVKLGIMLNHNDTISGQCKAGPTGQCSNGAYVLMGFDKDKTRFHSQLAAIPIPGGNNSHPFQGKELYFELFRWLTGQAIYNGHKGWEDFGDTDKNTNLDVDNPALKWDSGVESGTSYVSPMTDHCSKVFAINFLFQVSNQEADSDNAIKASKANGGMNGYDPGNSNAAFANVIRWMRDADLADGTYGTAPNLEDVQNVTSFFFVDPTKINTTTNAYASAGGTNQALPLSSDPDVLIASLKDVFKQILSVSTSFVSAAVPVNVFNRVETLEHVFFALFQPEAEPRWNGNLKRLKLAQDTTTGNLIVMDQKGIEAISSTDGRIKNEALTFWTDASKFDVQTADSKEQEVVGADGRSVPRGGAGQRVAGFLSGSPGAANSDSGVRKLYTEPDSHTNGTPTALRALDANSSMASAAWDALRKNGTLYSSNWSAAASYGAAPAADQSLAVNLLKFARGLDLTSECTANSLFCPANVTGFAPNAHIWAAPPSTPPNKYRPWLLADPIHSRPTPVNYGTLSGYSAANQNLRILLAGNDGFLHMFRNAQTDGTAGGDEVWAFMPRQLLGNLKPLADNGTVTKHVWGLDGTVVTYSTSGSDGNPNKVWAYVGMRRGGRGYYALDITDPDNPKMLWSIVKIVTKQPDGTYATTSTAGNFDDLGLTFSTPTVGQLDWGSGSKPVVIFAGGYAGGYDDSGNALGKDQRSIANSKNAATGTDDAEGNAIYIVNAETGALIKKFTKTENSALLDSIPSAVTAIDTDRNGLTDRFYVGDTGGVVWRGDLAGNDPSAWTLTQVLSVGRHAGQPDRRFFHAPDFVQGSDDSGPFDAVIIGSGDREHPLDTNVANQFYVLKDRNTISGAPPSTDSGNCSPTAKAGYPCPPPSNVPFQVSNLANLNDCSSPMSLWGWFIDIGTSASGEKVLTSPLTYFGRVYFSSYTPAGQSDTNKLQCGPSEGTSLTYVLSLFNACGVFNLNTANGPTADRFVATGSGIPSDPVYIAFNGHVYVTPGNLAPNEAFRNSLPGRALWQIYWYQQE